MTLAQLKKMARENRVEFVDLKVADLLGLWHHITIPVSSLNADLFKNGVGVDGSSMPGFSKIERGDMIQLPDPNTAFMDPFFDRPTLSMICDIMDVTDQVRPYSRNPRRVTRDAQTYLRKVKPGLHSMIGPEFEFYVFDKVNFWQGPDHAFYYLDSVEAEWNAEQDDENLGYKIPYKKGYHVAPPMDRTINLRNEICAMLMQIGVSIKYHHHEVGGGGQHEIETNFTPMLRMSDQSMIIKYFVRNQSFRKNRSATFMPKPLFNEPGSGLHVHQYLADSKGSVFYEKTGPAGLSKIGRYYVGGILKHVNSLLAFTNPSTNSFKRLVPGFEAPVAATYSVANRTACIRIPGYNRDPRITRLEFRPGDGTMNPYLGYAAMLMAGIDGIKNKIDPGLPLDKNLDKLPPDDLAQIHRLPTSLTKALNALKADHSYLLEGGVFTEDLLQKWVSLKHEDISAISIRPTPYEFQLYYDI
ncbi:MAG: type I glutamate--ammonia ligase [bacterium]